MTEYTEKSDAKSPSTVPKGAVDEEGNKRRAEGMKEALDPANIETPEKTSENVGNKSGGEEHGGA